jgi:hypothetical protein
VAIFDGQNIFGASVSCVTADNPRAAQDNAYPGLSGIESLDQGLRGRFTTVTGILYGPGVGGLAAAEATVRNYNDGYAYTFVDNSGTAWAQVKLESFEPQGRVRQTAGYLCVRPYTIRLRHLS